MICDVVLPSDPAIIHRHMRRHKENLTTCYLCPTVVRLAIWSVSFTRQSRCLYASLCQGKAFQSGNTLYINVCFTDLTTSSNFWSTWRAHTSGRLSIIAWTKSSKWDFVFSFFYSLFFSSIAQIGLASVFLLNGIWISVHVLPRTCRLVGRAETFALLLHSGRPYSRFGVSCQNRITFFSRFFSRSGMHDWQWLSLYELWFWVTIAILFCFPLQPSVCVWCGEAVRGPGLEKAMTYEKHVKARHVGQFTRSVLFWRRRVA